MPLNLAQFHAHLGGDALKPVYLLAGAEHLLLLEAADALRARARALGYSEREVLEADVHFDWDELARSAAGMSLFAQRRLLDLRLPTGKPGRDGSAALQAYCEAPPADTVLLVTCNEWSKKHEGAWSEAIERAGAFVPVWPLKPDELPSWLNQRLAARGLTAAPEAIEALIDRTEGNLLAAAQEIDKLALLAGGRKLDAAMLKDLVADSTHYDVFKLADAALSGDAARALRILAGLRAVRWHMRRQQMHVRLQRLGGLPGGPQVPEVYGVEGAAEQGERAAHADGLAARDGKRRGVTAQLASAGSRAAAPWPPAGARTPPRRHRGRAPCSVHPRARPAPGSAPSGRARRSARHAGRRPRAPARCARHGRPAPCWAPRPGAPSAATG